MHGTHNIKLSLIHLQHSFRLGIFDLKDHIFHDDILRSQHTRQNYNKNK